ncbi:Hypothetical predicted protein, partial [Pelobates cultripes]
SAYNVEAIWSRSGSPSLFAHAGHEAFVRDKYYHMRSRRDTTIRDGGNTYTN